MLKIGMPLEWVDLELVLAAVLVFAGKWPMVAK
jgi:hypothetical protein